MGFCFGREKSLERLIMVAFNARNLPPASISQTTIGEFNSKCFCIFGMVQHIFLRIDLSSQDAAPTFFNEML
ncbi:hypothetical protein AO262_29830 [Pseudomonas fluorescens ABAC62]|nr:hypothetical protein AO262_29830 [Pseudomonas fluorescens ABAC62]